MRRPQGYATLTDRFSGRMQERDTYQCAHCQKIIHVPPRRAATDFGGLCRNCDSLICPVCVRAGLCLPHKDKIERAMRRAAVVGEY